MKHFIVDAHEDLAWNMLTFKRDYTRAAHITRQVEIGTPVVERNGDTLLGYPDYVGAKVGIVFGTLFASPARKRFGEWDTECYRDSEEAHKLYRNQIDAYHRLTNGHNDKFRLILDKKSLEEIYSAWKNYSGGEVTPPVGLTILMEGAEGVRSVDELELWWELGVRTIGPAWIGTRFCGGTREPGPLTDAGRELLHAMEEFNFTLDLSHMAWESAIEALDLYKGPIIATHANALRMVKGSDLNRHLTDEIIDGIIARNGVIGVVPFNRFLVHGWDEKSSREEAPLQLVASMIDYICQRAGNAQHAGFGTDFDGGFGVQQTPLEIDTINDLHKIAPLLESMGYSSDDIASIFGNNWVRHLRNNLP